MPFEEVADGLRANYEEEIKFSQYNETVAGWMEAANIRYYPERF